MHEHICVHPLTLARAPCRLQVHARQPERRACLWRRPAHRQDAGHARRSAGAPQVPSHQGAARPGVTARASHALAAPAGDAGGPEELEDPPRHLQLEER